MKEKEEYTFEELCINLKMPMSQFCQMAGVTEGTMARLRKGYSARRATINSVLEAFSQAYKISFSLENVSGLTPVEKPVTPITKSRVVPANAALSKEPEHISKRSEDIPEYAPEGTMKMIDFSQSSGIPASTLGRWARGGKIEVITVPRVSGPGEQHFITPEGQKKAMELDKARKANDPAA